MYTRSEPSFFLLMICDHDIYPVISATVRACVCTVCMVQFFFLLSHQRCLSRFSTGHRPYVLIFKQGCYGSLGFGDTAVEFVSDELGKGDFSGKGMKRQDHRSVEEDMYQNEFDFNGFISHNH